MDIDIEPLTGVKQRIMEAIGQRNTVSKRYDEDRTRNRIGIPLASEVEDTFRKEYIRRTRALDEAQKLLYDALKILEKHNAF